jgi:predicted TIM-barrel fold metal-dependent hydrolase
MQSDMSTLLTDTHFHVFKGGGFAAEARYVPQYNAALSEWMQRAHSMGVRRGVLVQPSFLGTDNQQMLRALAAYPKELRGVAVVPPTISRNDIEALHRQGVRGIRLNLAGLSHEIPEWSRADALWHTMEAIGWHLEIHTDPGGLPKVLAQLPTHLPLVVDHMGKPMSARREDDSCQMLVQRSGIQKVYIKLSAAYRLGGLNPLDIAQIWLQELGAGALLWGSDWPCTNHEHLANYSELFNALSAWIGSENLLQVLAANPNQLYWTDAQAQP